MRPGGTAEITFQQRDRARRVGNHREQRNRVFERDRLRHRVVRHRSAWSGEPCSYRILARITFATAARSGVPSARPAGRAGRITREHAFRQTARLLLLAEVMQHEPQHPVADQHASGSLEASAAARYCRA